MLDLAKNQDNFQLRVMAGQVSGWSFSQFFSAKFAVTLTSAQLVWENGAEEYPWLTSATQMQVSSGASGDTNIDVTISGLDTNYDQITETLTLNGQNAVGTTQSFLRINDFSRSGGTGSITGEIYLSKSGDTLTAGVPAISDRYAIIQAHSEFSGLSSELVSDNTAHSPVFTVPRHHIAIVTNIKCTAGEGQELLFWGRVRAMGNNYFSNRYPLPTVNTVNPVTLDDPIILPGGADLCYYAAKVGQNADAAIKTSYYLVRE